MSAYTPDQMIPFNKPHLSGRELVHIVECFERNSQTSGNGPYTKKVQQFFEARYHFHKTLLTTSCTDALEMSAILANIQPGDEVIIPAYTFVSTANAFVLRGAKLVFADSEHDTPNLDVQQVEALITDKTKAIVPVHYAGMAVDMDPLLALAEKHGLLIIEDAAQAIEATYKGRPLGGIGHMSAFSFHETKNIIAGEGGMFVANDARFKERAEIIWEKGTNRAAFYRGEVDKYGWVDVGSSFLPADIIAAFLWGQLEQLEHIQRRRVEIWERYAHELQPLEAEGKLKLPKVPNYASKNGHLFYLELESIEQRQAMIAHLRKHNVHAVFHYLALHESPFFKDKHDGRALPNTVRWADCLLRLPLFFSLSDAEQQRVIAAVASFFES